MVDWDWDILVYPKNEGRFDFNLVKAEKVKKRIMSCTMMIKTRICWRRMTMAVLTCMGWCRLVWGPVAVSELVGLVAACWCTPPPVCPQTCCTPPMLQAPVYPQTHRHTHSATLNKTKRQNLYKIDKYQNSNTTSSLRTSASSPISGTKDTHNVFFSKRKIFNEYQFITQVRHSMFFLSNLSVLLWKSWKMIHQ